MFTTINMELARERMSVKDLATKAGIKYSTLLSKMNGHSEFNRSEMLRIQSAFDRKVPLEVLFNFDQQAS